MSNFHVSGVAINGASLAPATITDCAGSCGTAGQVLSSTGTALEWVAGGGGGGGSPATPTVEGILYGASGTTAPALTALGCFAGDCQMALTSAMQNIAVGICAMRSFNCAGGSQSGKSVAVGHQALYSGTNHAYEVAIGYRAGRYISYAVALGEGYNISIGRDSLSSIGNASQNVAIGPFALTNLGQNDCTVLAKNNIAIGANAGADTWNNLLAGCNWVIVGNCSSVCYRAKAAWSTASDVRDKAIESDGVPYGLDFVNQINPIVYRMCNRDNGELRDTKYKYGFAAQEILGLETDPRGPVIVQDENPESLSMTDQHLLPVLVNAIKELSTKVDSLQSKLDTLT